MLEPKVTRTLERSLYLQQDSYSAGTYEVTEYIAARIDAKLKGEELNEPVDVYRVLLANAEAAAAEG